MNIYYETKFFRKILGAVSMGRSPTSNLGDRLTNPVLSLRPCSHACRQCYFNSWLWSNQTHCLM